MKKLLSLLLVALCAVIIVPLSACSKEIELTTDNYDEYLLLTTEYDDIEVFTYADLDNFYLISFIYRISASPKGDYRFNNVEIKVTWESTEWLYKNITSDFSEDESGFFTSLISAEHPSLNVDYYGYGSVSRYEYKQTSTSTFNVANSDFTLEIYSISGTVTV